MEDFEVGEYVKIIHKEEDAPAPNYKRSVGDGEATALDSFLIAEIVNDVYLLLDRYKIIRVHKNEMYRFKGQSKEYIKDHLWYRTTIVKQKIEITFSGIDQYNNFYQLYLTDEDGREIEPVSNSRFVYNEILGWYCEFYAPIDFSKCNKLFLAETNFEDRRIGYERINEDRFMFSREISTKVPREFFNAKPKFRFGHVLEISNINQ